MTGRRGILLALSWAAAATAGFLFAWLLRTEPGVRIEYRETAAPLESGADGGGVRGTPSNPVPVGGSPRPGGTGAPPAAIPAEPAIGSGSDAFAPPASILVTVQNPEGTPVEAGGSVYALSPGEPGTDDERDLCSASIEGDGTARLRLPGAGTYDIGAATSWGTALAQDVKVSPGDGATLTLRLPGDAAIRVVCETPWPPPVEDPGLAVSLWTEDEGKVDHPGRGQAGSRGTQFEVGPDGTGASGLLPTGSVFHVSVHVLETCPQYFADTEDGRRKAVRQNSLRYVVEPHRETARPGETVRVRIRPVGVLVVDTEGEPALPQGTAPGHVVNMKVVFTQGETRVAAATAVSGGPWRPKGVPDGQGNFAPRPRLLFRGASGPCRLEWSGQWIRAGTRDDVVLRAGEVLLHTIAFQGDPAGREAPTPDYGNEPGDGEPVPEPEPLEMTAQGLPEGRQVRFYVVRSGEQGEREWWVEDGQEDESGRITPSTVLEGVPREGATAFAVSPPDLVSDPAAAPASGSMTFPLRPGGLLLVAPEEVFPAEFGRLKVRLADGRPFLSWNGDQRGDAEGEHEFVPGGETPVSAGTVLGPFPEGRITFQVRLGGVRLPDATAVVKAGRIEVLRIRR